MATALHSENQTAVWQTGDNAVSRLQDVLVPAERSYSLNISSLPAPDQSRIWTFLEFMHEYSSTAWRLVSGADADICVVDGLVSTLTLRICNRVLRRGQEHTVLLSRPLQMETFATTLLQLEAPHPVRLCGRVVPLFSE